MKSDTEPLVSKNHVKGVFLLVALLSSLLASIIKILLLIVGLMFK